MFFCKGNVFMDINVMRKAVSRLWCTGQYIYLGLVSNLEQPY